ncbi:RNA polymerase sigma factor [Robertkochia sp. 1368]|nr:RNA polymerase sigma factor [Robertkochia sediminum]
MKVVSLHNHLSSLIKRAKAGDREAQNEIYKRYAPKMLGVCRSYVSDLQYAEDIMVTGFFKVFDQISKFREEGSFEGWMRRIMVRQCIDHLRKKRPEQFVDPSEDALLDGADPGNWSDTLEVELLQRLIDDMPEGYRSVFLLYAVEGYQHKEIAAVLNISESTSKTQLFKARKLLQHKLVEIKDKAYEVRRIR